ncbi:MAG: DUF3251 domain-containing protein [Comamonadaceae bacterium]|nr:MAG: DUF3251 domain-containing protein [Comamonadaceae bacterium]
MLYTRVFLGAAVATFVLAGCSGGEGETTALKNDISTLQQETKQLRTELSDLRTFVHTMRRIDGMDKVAFLTPGSEGYTVVTSDLGKLTVSIANVVPYANGSKVTLQIGNLTAGSIEGLKAKIEWGTLDQSGLPDLGSTRSRDVVLKDKLVSGSWTNSDVVLERIAPTELGFVRLVDVGHRGVILRR